MTPTPLLTVPAAPEIVNLFPDFRPVDPTTGTIPHDLGSTVLLRKLGYDVPSPVSLYYDFPHPPGKPPFAVQKETVELLTENQRAYVLSGMGVGKTACPIWAFDYLRRLGLATRMVVFCPLSTLKFTWGRECFDFTPHLKVSVVYGSKRKRLDALAADADIYLINHDGWQVVGEELKQRPDIDVLCLDEIAVYRNSTDRSKWMQKFAQTKKWVWGMTGEPTPHAPTDVWGQAKIVTPHTVPKYFGRFRDELMVKWGPFKWLPRPNANELAYKALQPSVRFALEDVTELPPYISRRIDVELGPKQKEIYNQLRLHAYSLVDNHEITAANAGAALNKLLQVSLGWVYNAKGAIVQLDNDARLAALLDLLEAREHGSRVIVFSAFKHVLAGLEQAIRTAGHIVASVSGDTPAGKRGEIFDAFQNGDGPDAPDVLNAHPQCMAHGLTLTRADTIVWFGPITSLEIYDQANHRIRRVGQRKKQQFLHLQATPAERRLYSLLVNNQTMQNELLDMFRE
jgi:SNF2 family DNA or RNA helicase